MSNCGRLYLNISISMQSMKRQTLACAAVRFNRGKFFGLLLFEPPYLSFGLGACLSRHKCEATICGIFIEHL